MNLALTILFLWLGFALLFVAFHPISLETSKGAPRDVLRFLQNKIAGTEPVSGGITGPIVGGVEQGLQGLEGTAGEGEVTTPPRF